MSQIACNLPCNLLQFGSYLPIPSLPKHQVIPFVNVSFICQGKENQTHGLVMISSISDGKNTNSFVNGFPVSRYGSN